MMHSLAPLLSHRWEEEKAVTEERCVQERRSHSSSSSHRGGRGGPAAALTQHFQRKYPRSAGRAFGMEAFVRAPPPVQHPAGDRMEARLPQIKLNEVGVEARSGGSGVNF